jgi:hypothetical protein
MRLGTNQPMGPLRLADFIGERLQYGQKALLMLPGNDCLRIASQQVSQGAGLALAPGSASTKQLESELAGDKR